MFQKRLKNNQNISMSEFLYPLMQGYDSVVMDVDVEIGGSDQLFNMMVGRDLMHKIKRKNKFVMTTPLLTDSSGTKIGKTEGNAIALTDKPEDLYKKIMLLSDDIIVKGFEYLTDIPMDEIKSIKRKLSEGINPLDFKRKLAFEIVKQLNNEEQAQKASELYESTTLDIYNRKDMNVLESLPTVSISGPTISDALYQAGLAVSKSDAKRLVMQGTVSIIDLHELKPVSITNPFELLPKKDVVIKSGKEKKIVKVKVSSDGK
jgi:tyrosyl-tRNA synthetase